MTIKTLIHIKLIVLLLLSATSCSKSIDITKPEEVTLAFLNAIKDNDMKAAYSHMHESLQATEQEFSEELSGELKQAPPMPDQFKVTCEVDKNDAECDIFGWFDGADLDLVFDNGRWWIVR